METGETRVFEVSFVDPDFLMLCTRHAGVTGMGNYCLKSRRRILRLSDFKEDIESRHSNKTCETVDLF